MNCDWAQVAARIGPLVNSDQIANAGVGRILCQMDDQVWDQVRDQVETAVMEQIVDRTFRWAWGQVRAQIGGQP